MINCGGAVPGEVDKATHGMPGKFTFCFGELEEQNPWEPYHVEHGFGREQDTLTAFGGQGTANMLNLYLEPENIMHMLADGMRCYGYNSYYRASGSPLIVLNPGHARILSERGWDKRRIKQELFECTKIPRSYVPNERSLLKPVYIDYPPEEMCLICREPDDIEIVVAGGPEAYHITYIPSFHNTVPITVAINSPERSKQ